MASYGYKDDAGEYNWTAYNTSSHDLYAVLPPQSSSEYFAYEFGEPKIAEYSSYSYFDQHYYACNLSEPSIIRYDPSPLYAVDSCYSQTSYRVSYSNLNSNSELNDLDFEEYDPTPYSGGYDPVKTYGKPLPPSDETCYPRSSVQPKPDSESLDGFSYSSLPPAYGGKNEQPEKSKPVASEEPKSSEEEVVRETEDGGGDGDVAECDDSGGNGGSSYVPYGAGLESMDICESIFGYWPCLAKMEREKKACRVCEVEDSRYDDPWDTTADYLFGSPFPYGEQQYQNLYRDYQH